MGSSWYYRSGAREHGPISSSELLRMARRREIFSETEVRRSDKERWVAAADVKGLFEPMNALPPTSTTERKSAPAEPWSNSPPPLMQSLPQPLAAGTRTQTDSPKQAAPGSQRNWFRWITGSVAALAVLVVVGANVFMIVLDRPETVSPQLASVPVADDPSNEQEPSETRDPTEEIARQSVPANDSEAGLAKPSAETPETISPFGVPGAADGVKGGNSPDSDGNTTTPQRGMDGDEPIVADVAPFTPAEEEAILKTTAPGNPTGDVEDGEKVPPNAPTDTPRPEEEPPAQSPPDGKASSVEASEPSDRRLERLTEIHQSTLALGNRWEDFEKVIQANLKEDAGLQNRFRQVVINIKLVQGEVAQVARSLADELSRRDGRPAPFQLRLGTLNTQLQGLNANGAALGQQSLQITVKNEETRRRQLALNHEAAKSYGEWFLLCDPLGKLGLETHRRGKALFEEWRRTHEKLPLPHVAHGFACLRLGYCQEALRDFSEAEKLFAASPEASQQMYALMAAAKGCALQLQARQSEQHSGNRKDADVKRAVAAEFGKAFRRDSKLGLINLFRGHAAMLDDEHTKASSELKKGLQLAERAKDPMAAMVFLFHEELALFLASCPYDSVRNGRLAVEHATLACDMTEWRKWPYLETLAIAHAETGNFEEAARWASKALELSSPDDRPSIEEKLALFQEHRPYRLGQALSKDAAIPPAIAEQD